MGVAFSALTRLDVRKSIRPVKIERWGAGVDVCLKACPDLIKFSSCYLWSWLNLPMTAMQYITYSLHCGPNFFSQFLFPKFILLTTDSVPIWHCVHVLDDQPSS